MFYVFEKIEGDYAVLVSDQKETFSLLKSQIEGKIGDVFAKDESGRFVFDQNETERRHADIVSRHRSLFKK